MEIDNIRRFLKVNYSDEQLAALCAHTESGKLSYHSCCCLIGGATANHGLKGHGEAWPDMQAHYLLARTLPFAARAESEFQFLGANDEERRERVKPLIREEMDRRERERLASNSAVEECALVP